VSHTLQGADVRKWREESGLTQEEAARKLGIAREWLSKVENGKTPVSADLFLKLGTLRREEHFTTAGSRSSMVRDDAGPSGTTDSLRKEIRERIEDVIRFAGDDAGKLGWIREQVIRHASAPDHWDIREEVIKKVLESEKKESAGDQSTRAQGKAS
jgi:transcriptional regulator with XRE-family HTH domain